MENIIVSKLTEQEIKDLLIKESNIDELIDLGHKYIVDTYKDSFKKENLIGMMNYKPLSEQDVLEEDLFDASDYAVISKKDLIEKLDKCKTLQDLTKLKSFKNYKINVSFNINRYSEPKKESVLEEDGEEQQQQAPVEEPVATTTPTTASEIKGDKAFSNFALNLFMFKSILDFYNNNQNSRDIHVQDRGRHVVKMFKINENIVNNANTMFNSTLSQKTHDVISSEQNPVAYLNKLKEKTFASIEIENDKDIKVILTTSLRLNKLDLMKKEVAISVDIARLNTFNLNKLDEDIVENNGIISVDIDKFLDDISALDYRLNNELFTPKNKILKQRAKDEKKFSKYAADSEIFNFSHALDNYKLYNLVQSYKNKIKEEFIKCVRNDPLRHSFSTSPKEFPEEGFIISMNCVFEATNYDNAYQSAKSFKRTGNYNVLADIARVLENTIFTPQTNKSGRIDDQNLEWTFELGLKRSGHQNILNADDETLAKFNSDDFDKNNKKKALNTELENAKRSLEEKNQEKNRLVQENNDLNKAIEDKLESYKNAFIKATEDDDEPLKADIQRSRKEYRDQVDIEAAKFNINFNKVKEEIAALKTTIEDLTNQIKDIDSGLEQSAFSRKEVEFDKAKHERLRGEERSESILANIKNKILYMFKNPNNVALKGNNPEGKPLEFEILEPNSSWIIEKEDVYTNPETDIETPYYFKLHIQVVDPDSYTQPLDVKPIENTIEPPPPPVEEKPAKKKKAKK